MKLNCLAIIGLGSIGRRHLRLISEIRPDIKIIAVRSGHGERCDEEKMAAKTVYSIGEAVDEGVQAAIISSPATLHLKQSLELAKNGIHLLIEKPISHTSDMTGELLKIVNNNNITVMVGYVLRYEPGAIKFKNWLSSKMTGKILHVRIECGSYLPDWRPEQNYKETVSALSELGGGVLLELSHEIDYLHWFFGKPIDVQAQVRNSETLDISVEDQVDLLITNEEGFLISVQLDFNRRYTKRSCSVITTEGELIWDAVKKNVVWKCVGEEQSKYTYNNERDSIYRKQLKIFFDCIENNNDPIVTIEDGINVINLIDAVRKASEKGVKVLL
jgi:predicted dehydrogenase